MLSQIGQTFLDYEMKLANELQLLNFPEPVNYVYNPIDYASETHTDFISKYANDSPKQIMFLGMNPGPWGMAQTGMYFLHNQSWSTNCVSNF